MANEGLGKDCLLGDDEVGLILNRVSEPPDRKSFSKVCKQWLRVEGLTLSSIRRLLGPQLLSQFPNLVTFETSEYITETDLKFIAQTCPEIEVVNLNSKLYLDVAEKGLCALARGCPKLSRVSLRGRQSELYGKHVSFVYYAQNLTYLDLGRCYISVSDKSLEVIGSSCSISYLNLEACFHITDTGLGFLANGPLSKTLKTLVLAQCFKITDVGVSQLQKMHCLEHLDLAHLSKVTDIGAVAISGIQTLKKLNLKALISVSDDTIVVAAENCLKLEVLDLSCCSVTGAGIRGFTSHMCLESLVLLRLCGDYFNVSDVEHVILGCPSLKSIVVDSSTSRWMLPLMQESCRRFLTVVD